MRFFFAIMQKPILLVIPLPPPNDMLGTSMINCHCFDIATADIQFTFPTVADEEEELRMIFNWKANLMSNIGKGQEPSVVASDLTSTPVPPSIELLMFALPHHQERMRRTELSSNMVQSAGCMPTIHGVACPVRGSAFFMLSY